MAQDSAGFLWLAYRRALDRFDGHSFKTFYPDPNDSTSLLPRSIETVYVDRTGTIWLGYSHIRGEIEAGAMSRFDSDTETFTHFRHDPNDPTSVSSDTVNVMLEDSQGDFWIGTKRGLNRFDRATGTFTHFLHDPDDPTSLSYDEVRTIYEDSQGVLWVGTGDASHDEGGLNRLERTETDTGTKVGFTRFLHDPNDPTTLGHNLVQAILEDSRGQLWVGTRGDGLHLMDRESGRFSRPFSLPIPDPCPLWYCGVSFIHEDQAGAVWIGVYSSGLVRYDPDTGSIRHFTAGSNQPGSLRSNEIWRMVEILDGSLWVSNLGVGAVHRIVPSTITFPLILANNKFDHQNNQNNRLVTGIHMAADGALWTSTYGAGINRLDPVTGQFRFYTAEPDNPNGLPGNTAYFIYEDRQGMIWTRVSVTNTEAVGTRGIVRLEPETNRFTHYEHNPDDPASLGHNFAGPFLEDRNGAFWIATSNGLDRLDRETGTFTHFLHDENDPTSLSKGDVDVLYEDREGVLWVGTQGGGVSRMVTSGEKTSFERFLTHIDKSTVISSILEDREGRFWVSTTNVSTATGILYLLNRKDGSYQEFTVDDGLAAGCHLRNPRRRCRLPVDQFICLRFRKS